MRPKMLRSAAVRAVRRVVSAGAGIGPGGARDAGAGLPTSPDRAPLQAVQQQQQRAFADAAVATKATIWDELGDLVSSDEGKRELATLRSTYTDISQKLAAMAKVGGVRSNWDAGRGARAGVWAAAAGGGRRRAPAVARVRGRPSLPRRLAADP